MIELSIIILNYKTYELTMQCISSLLATQKKIEYRIIIIDDCSPNESIPILEKWISTLQTSVPIILSKTEKNGGYSSALNRGILEAQKFESKFVAIINNDLIYEKEYFYILVNSSIQFPEIAIWGGSIQGKDGNWQVAYKSYISSGSFLLLKRPLSFFFRRKTNSKIVKSRDCISKFYGMVSGCCFLFNINLIKKIGFWDEKIFLNHEEDSIAAKLKNEGLQCGVNPEATVIHLGSQTIGARTPFQYYHRYISEIYVLKKYYNAQNWQLFLLKIIDNIAIMKNIHEKEARNTYRKSFNEYYKTIMNESKA